MNKKLILFFLLLPAVLCAQHYINGTFSPAPDYKFVILYRVTPTATLYTVDAPVSKDGTFKLELDSKVKSGTYILTYGIPQETFNFDVVYNGKEDVTLTYSQTDGLKFTSDGQNKMLSEYLQAMESVKKEINDELISEKPNDNTIKNLLQKQAKIQASAEKNSEGSYVSTFIKANRPFNPENFEDDEMYSKNRKDNYFANFDFNNLQLQSSSFPLNKIKDYYEEFNSKNDNVSYKTNIDCIQTQLANTDTDFQKALLTNFWTSLITDTETDAANYLAQEYIIPLAKTLGDHKLIKELTMFKNMSLGVKAPDFSWPEKIEGKSKTQSLYDLEGAENYILVFWSAECSHCLKEIPIFYEKMVKQSAGKFKVIAVGLEDEPDNWQKMISEYPKFINVLGLKKWDNEIAVKYGIMGTPTFFLLDKDKKLITKLASMEDLFKAMDTLVK